MKSLFKSAILFITVLIISADGRTFFQTAASIDEKLNAVDAFVTEQMSQFHIPGLSLVIVRDGKIIKAKGYGLANVELNVAAKPDTAYEIGSVTKQFTSTAIMLLVEENKIKLDAPIGDYLTDIPAVWQPITVRQLLNQTSGIKDYFNDNQPGFLEAAHFPATKQQILKPALTALLNYAPGESYNYSNTNHFLLGLLIEKISGKSYADFMRTRIFEPLGMTSTRINDHKITIKNRAAGYGYDWSVNVLRNADYVDASWSFAAGAVISTVNDLAQWDIALDTEKLVKNTSKKEMWTAGKLNSGAAHRYGFGWYVDRVNGHTNLSHGGDIPGFATYYSRYPDDRLTVIMSMNQYIYPKRISDKIAEMYLPALVYRTIDDKDPQFTRLVQKLYADLAAGKPDLWEKNLFTPELWKSLKASFSVEGNVDFYKRLGAAKSLTLVERIEDERGLLTRYRASYGNNARLVKFVRSRAGLISEWEDYEE